MKIKIKKSPSRKSKFVPLTQDLLAINGPSHENGGISFMGVEAEGGEVAYSGMDNSTTIFGNLYVPGANKKFKNVAKDLAKKEQKVDKLIEKGSELVNSYDWHDKWDALKFNAGRAMLEGGMMKKQELKQNKEHLSALQQALLETADEMGADPLGLSKGKVVKAKNGVKIKYANGGDPGDGWDFKGTNKSKLDKKLLEFVDMVVKKGYTGYSGPNSGYDVRNTKSGRKSRHASGQALDMIFNDKDIYQKILKDPELTSFLVNNGLTVINEYDEGVKKKTGADVGHLHIGYDQGTGISDAFRKEAASLYQTSNPTWNWTNRVFANSKPLKGVKSGDAQLPNYSTPELSTKIPGNKQQPKPRTVTPGDYDLGITPIEKTNIPSNARGMEWWQIAPELVAFGQNKVEPVWMQQFNPQLYQQTQVSFQDRLNDNQASFNSLERIMKDNPTALATLAGQKYAADNTIRGEEFRTNQQIEQDIVNKNISLLNDAQLKNLQLADTQYVRQSQAKSNTKALNNTILNSITGKIAQNTARNQALKYYESLTNYRYNPETGQVEYMGENMAKYLPTDGSTTTQDTSNTQTRQTYDKSGNLKSTTYTTPGWLDQAVKAQQYQQGQYKKLNQVLGQNDSINKFFNTYQKKGK
jgi:YD repeat-containing protein